MSHDSKLFVFAEQYFHIRITYILVYKKCTKKTTVIQLNKPL